MLRVHKVCGEFPFPFDVDFSSQGHAVSNTFHNLGCFLCHLRAARISLQLFTHFHFVLFGRTKKKKEETRNHTSSIYCIKSSFLLVFFPTLQCFPFCWPHLQSYPKYHTEVYELQSLLQSLARGLFLQVIHNEW